MNIKDLVCGLTFVTLIASTSFVEANPTREALKEHVYDVTYHYAELITRNSLKSVIRGCGMLGYRRDSTIVPSYMSDEQQQQELILQTNRCICYMEFINSHYPIQVHPNALTENILKELVISSLFVELESLDRIFYQFDECPP